MVAVWPGVGGSAAWCRDVDAGHAGTRTNKDLLATNAIASVEIVEMSNPTPRLIVIRHGE